MSYTSFIFTAILMGSSLLCTTRAEKATCPLPVNGKHSISIGMPYEEALDFLKKHPNTMELVEGVRQLAFYDGKSRRMHTVALKNGKDTLLVIGVADQEGASYVLEYIIYEPNSIPNRPKAYRDSGIHMQNYPSTLVPNKNEK